MTIQREYHPLRWYPSRHHPWPTIGIVLLIDHQYKYWKAYIGSGYGNSEVEDARVVVEQGSRFDEDLARMMAGRLVDGLEYAP